MQLIEGVNASIAVVWQSPGDVGIAADTS